MAAAAFGSFWPAADRTRARGGWVGLSTPVCPDATGRTHGPWPSRATDSVATDAVGRGPGDPVPGAGGLAADPVLILQAVLSLRLIRADTAFQDEALYLWAGHLEWASLLHGASLPPFPSFFSGAPVIYPPLAALADTVGGLDGARVLSLVFMLGATALLYATTGRLAGRWAAFFAAGLFAVLGPTLHLGSFATYDAMAAVPGRAGGLAGGAGRGPRGRDALDGRGGRGAGAGQPHLLPLGPVRPGGDPAGLAGGAAQAGRAAGREPGADPAGHRGRPGQRGPAARRQPVPPRGRGDHADPGTRPGLTAHCGTEFFRLDGIHRGGCRVRGGRTPGSASQERRGRGW